MTNRTPKWITTAHFKFDFFSFSSICASYQTAMNNLLGFSFNYKYSNLDIYYDEHNFADHESLLEKSDLLIKEHIDFIEIQSGVLLELSRKLGSNNDFASFSEWYSGFIEFLPSLGLVIAPERVLVKKIKKFLSEGDFMKISFSEETGTSFELRDLLLIASKKVDAQTLRQLAEKHDEKYSWLGNKWMSYNPTTVDDVLERIKGYQGKAITQLQFMESSRQKMNDELLAVMDKLTTEEKFFIEQYRRLLYWRTTRGEAAAISCSLTLPLFTWVGSQVGLDRSQVVKYSFAELKKSIGNRKKIGDSQKREIFNATMIDGDLKVEWDPVTSEDNPNQSNPTSMVNSFVGMVASKGIASGLVRIIHDMPDLKTFERGEILVAVGTNPNMVIAMEKAAAFVTDVGNLTSHAAIISRELNVPCIIGTKIATKVLRSGDEVEVDANKGVVTIIKRK